MKNVTKCHLSQFYQWNKNQKSRKLNRKEYRGRIQQFHPQPALEVLQKIQGKFSWPKIQSTQMHHFMPKRTLDPMQHFLLKLNLTHFQFG